MKTIFRTRLRKYLKQDQENVWNKIKGKCLEQD